MNDIINDYLCPPGSGVFTVNTAKEKKQQLHQHLYNNDDAQEVERLFHQHIAQLTELPAKQVGLLGVCSDTGGGIMRGANWGPLFIREKLYESNCRQFLCDLGDIRVIPHLLHDKYLNDDTLTNCRKALYGENKPLAVSPLSIAEDVTNHLYNKINNLKLFSLGGDHSVSYPLVKTFLQSRSNEKVGLIHFDAHTDLLHERLGIDLCFGSWLTHVLPYFYSPANVIQLGIRSSGKSKEHWQETFGISQYWADEIKQQGMEAIVKQCIGQFKAQGIEQFYISFDIDAIDASQASATGTPEPGGLDVIDCCYAIDALCQHFELTGADLVEVAPLVNPDSNPSEPETTLKTAQMISHHLITNLISN